MTFWDNEDPKKRRLNRIMIQTWEAPHGLEYGSPAYPLTNNIRHGLPAGDQETCERCWFYLTPSKTQ